MFISLFATLALVELILQIPPEDLIFPPLFSVFVAVVTLPFSIVLLLLLLRVMIFGTFKLSNEGLLYCAAIHGPMKNKFFPWDEIREIRLHLKTNRVELVLKDAETQGLGEVISSQRTLGMSFGVKDSFSGNKNSFVIGMLLAPNLAKAVSIFRMFPVTVSELELS